MVCLALHFQNTKGHVNNRLKYTLIGQYVEWTDTGKQLDGNEAQSFSFNS